jgi:hypothetical protein
LNKLKPNKKYNAINNSIAKQLKGDQKEDEGTFLSRRGIMAAIVWQGLIPKNGAKRGDFSECQQINFFYKGLKINMSASVAA